MDSLPEVLALVRNRLLLYRGKSIGEQNTKATLIEPILQALGWDTGDFDEVRREYRHKPGENPVDYALLLLRVPRLFVEAKGLDEKLDDPKCANQIMGYTGVAGIKWVLLTNGDEYRLYNAHALVPIDEKLFRRVQLSDAADRPEDLFDLIAKDRLQQNAIDTLWEAHFVDRQLRAAIERLFSTTPDAALVRLLGRRVSALSAKEVREGLARARITVDFPVAAVAQSPTPQSTPVQHAGGQPSAPQAEPRQARATPARNDIALRDLIGAGILSPPLALEKEYLGQHLSARLEADGRVTFGGRTFDSPSTAAGVARASVPGAPTGRKFPQTNGWTFWHFRDVNGTLQPLDTLRRQYQGAVKSSAS